MSSSRRVPADRLKLFPPMFNSWETTSSIFQIGIFTSVNITNHLSTNNTPDVIVEASSGGSPQTVPANVQLLGNNQLNISDRNLHLREYHESPFHEQPSGCHRRGEFRRIPSNCSRQCSTLGKQPAQYFRSESSPP